MTDRNEEPEIEMPNYLGMLRRRKWFFIILTPLLLAASVAVALLLPPVYRSSGTILVETQHIPHDLVRSTITSLASERIQIIKQRVMTREKLLFIADKYQLFKDKKASTPVSILLDELRAGITVKLITANNQKRRNASATIAFTVEFASRKPRTAQAVANELVTLFQSENVKARTERATEATNFLEQESNKLKQKLDEVEALIAEFKQNNKDALPEHLDLYMGMLTRQQVIEFELDREIKSTKAELGMLSVQFKAFQAQDWGDTQAASSEEMLYRKLKAEYAVLKTDYLPAHPTLAKMRHMIASAERSLKPSVRYRLLLEEKEEVEAALADFGSQASEESNRLKSELLNIESELEKIPARYKEEAAQVTLLSPAELEINAQITSAKEKISSLKRQLRRQKKEVKSLQKRIVQIPQVERGLKTLNRDYANTSRQYNEIKAKEMEARLSESLEEGRKAERFSILEPPLLPDQPSEPNRKKIMLFGLLASLFVPLGLVLLKEMLNPGIRGARSLELLIKTPPLVVVPYIETEEEQAKKRRILKTLIVAVVIGSVGAVLAVHFLYLSLDLIWFKVLHRIGLQ